MRVTKGDLHSWVECKKFESEQWEDWATELTHEIIRRVHESGNSQLPSFDVLFEPRLSDLTWQDKLIRRGILEEIAVRISAGVTLAFSITPARSVQIPGIAAIRVRDDRDSTQWLFELAQIHGPLSISGDESTDIPKDATAVTEFVFALGRHSSRVESYKALGKLIPVFVSHWPALGAFWRRLVELAIEEGTTEENQALWSARVATQRAS